MEVEGIARIAAGLKQPVNRLRQPRIPMPARPRRRASPVLRSRSGAAGTAAFFPRPSARRTADSRCRPTERDSSRFATLAHTISSSTPTSSIRIQSALVPGLSASRPRLPGRVIRSGSLAAPSGTRMSEQPGDLRPGGRFRDSGLSRPIWRTHQFPSSSRLSARRRSDSAGTRLSSRAARRRRATGRAQPEEPGRRDADDAGGHVVDAEVAVERLAAAEPVHPEAMAHDHDRSRADAIVVVAERPPDHGLGAEALEEVAADVLQSRLLGGDASDAIATASGWRRFPSSGSNAVCSRAEAPV